MSFVRVGGGPIVRAVLEETKGNGNQENLFFKQVDDIFIGLVVFLLAFLFWFFFTRERGP